MPIYNIPPPALATASTQGAETAAEYQENRDQLPITAADALFLHSGLPFTSGEAITAGYATGPKNASGVPKLYRASAASASTPGICVGIATATVGAADLAITAQSMGRSGVIPDAAWDAVPAVTDVDKPVYLSKTAGKVTLDVSAFATTDRVQQLGVLDVGGTGACRILIDILGNLTATQAQALALLSGNNTGDETKATIAAKTGITAAQMDLVALGAKSAIAVTLNAFNTWADGQTIVTPTVGSKTLQVTTTGDIDIRGLTETQAKAFLANYLSTAAGSVVDVSIVGTSSTMTVTAKAYGSTLNGTVISGTVLVGSGTMVLGLAPQVSNPPALATAVSPGAMPATDLTQAQMNRVSAALTAGGWTVPRIIYSAAITAAATVVVGGAGASPAMANLVSSRKYTFLLQLNAQVLATANVMYQANGSDANGFSTYILDNNATPGNAVGLYGAGVFNNKVLASKFVIEPRVNGVSFTAGSGKQGSSSGLGAVFLTTGYTTTDYTSITVNLGANARRGYLTVIEETPASAVLTSSYYLPDVANDFDPSVTGLAGRVGAQVGTIDEAKAWIKTGTGTTDWTAI
jgi:hypothetical protein